MIYVHIERHFSSSAEQNLYSICPNGWNVKNKKKEIFKKNPSFSVSAVGIFFFEYLSGYSGRKISNYISLGFNGNFDVSWIIIPRGEPIIIGIN